MGLTSSGLWRVAFRSLAVQRLVLAAVVHLLLARAGPDAALPVRPIPAARLALVAGVILAISFADAVSSTTPTALLLLAGCQCLWLFAARDSVAARRTRLLPNHATEFAHPVGCGIAMTFMLHHRPLRRVVARAVT